MPAQLPQNQPTPEEAARALQDIEQRRDQVLREGSGPRWMWYLLGAAFVVRGLVADLAGMSAASVVSWAIVAVLAVLVVMQHTRRGAARLGYRAMPAWNAFPAWYLGMLAVAAIATVIAASLLLGVLVAAFDLPYQQTIVGAGTGLAVALVGRWACRLAPPRRRVSGR